MSLIILGESVLNYIDSHFFHGKRRVICPLLIYVFAKTEFLYLLRNCYSFLRASDSDLRAPDSDIYALILRHSEVSRYHHEVFQTERYPFAEYPCKQDDVKYADHTIQEICHADSAESHRAYQDGREARYADNTVEQRQ